MNKTTLDQDPFLHHASWSPDGGHLAYGKGDDTIWVAGTRGDEPPRKLAETGTHPTWIGDQRILCESQGEIVEIATDGRGPKTVVGRNEIAKGTMKDYPVGHPSKGLYLFCCHFIFDKGSQQKNAYPHRHLLAVGRIDDKSILLTRQQVYGGIWVWFPDGERFAHFEYDSTGGAQVHVVNVSGQEEAYMSGHFPALSAAGTDIAARPRGGGGLLVYRRKRAAWNTDELDSRILRLPEASGRLSPNMPWWVDDRTVAVEEGKNVFRVDVRTEKSELWMAIPDLLERGESTLWPSPDGRSVAAVLASGEGQELAVLPCP